MHISASLPSPTTWQVLQKSRNTAAIATLACGLASRSPELRHRCLMSLLARAEHEALQAIVVNWERFDEHDVTAIRKEAHRFAVVTNAILVTGSLSEKRAALAMVSSLDLADSIEVVVEIVVNAQHALCSQATTCLLDMCERWGQLARRGSDRPSVRLRMLQLLGARLNIFQEHKNGRLVEAWLCLVDWEDSAQRALIADPLHPAYRCMLDTFASSHHPSVLELLVGYLWRNTAPKTLLAVLAERSQPAVATAIAGLVDNQTLSFVMKRLRDLPPLACLRRLDVNSMPIDEESQRKLRLMQAASSDDLPHVLDSIIRLSKGGTSTSRQTAAEMLRHCRRPDIDVLVPAIQASRLQSGHEPKLAELIHEITDWLQGPSRPLKRAAEDFLADFTIKNLLGQVRHWPAEMCRAMASIVAKMDGEIANTLCRELQCPSPKRRLAALQVTQMLDCVNEVSDALMPLLDDPRLDVRVRVIDLLAALGHDALNSLIPQLLDDASTDIQDAANRAMRRWMRNKEVSREPSSPHSAQA